MKEVNDLAIYLGSGKESHLYSVLSNTIQQIGILKNYNIQCAIYEKIEYNKTRADHKRENRAKKGGKKF